MLLQIPGHDNAFKVSFAFIERSSLTLLRRAMLKHAMRMTVWFMKASFRSATFDIADVKLCKALPA